MLTSISSRRSANARIAQRPRPILRRQSMNVRSRARSWSRTARQFARRPHHRNPERRARGCPEFEDIPILGEAFSPTNTRGVAPRSSSSSSGRRSFATQWMPRSSPRSSAQRCAGDKIGTAHPPGAVTPYPLGWSNERDQARRARLNTALTGGGMTCMAGRGMAKPARQVPIDHTPCSRHRLAHCDREPGAAPGTSGFLGGALGVLMLAVAVADARAFIIPDKLTIAAFGARP